MAGIDLSAILDQGGRAFQGSRLLRKEGEAEQLAKLKAIDTEDVLSELDTPGLSVERETDLLTRLATLQGPQISQAVTNIIQRGDERELAQGQAQSDEALKLGLFFEGIKDDAKLSTAIREQAQQDSAQGKDISKLVELINATPDKRQMLIKKQIISAGDTKTLLANRQKRNEATQFENVLNEDGEIVAQRNINTGEVKKSPLASGVRGGPNEKGTFTKSQSLLAKNPDGSITVLTPVTDSRTGKTTLERAPVEGEIISRQFGETGEQESARKVGQAGETEGTVLEARAKGIGAVEKAKVTNKGRATRAQERITKGIEASSSLPILNRGIELLDSVKTGGFAAASLRAKQAFGIESADEAELSSNLGKAVLSQLRTTFGAAFTENEGQRLARIEAGFSKSTAGNRRLLGQAKKIALDAAKRGLRQARAQGDTESVQEIQDLIDFKLTPDPEQTAPKAGDSFNVGKFKVRVK